MIGAMTPYYRIEESDAIRRACPLLRETAAVVADVQVRNQGTIGGSLAHADPTGDMPAAVLALEAELKAVGPGGERWLRAEEFFTGFFSTELAADEILTEIRVPALDGWSTAYLKAAPRAAGFAVAGVAVCLRQGADHTCEGIRIGVTGVTDKPYRAYTVENALRGRRLDDAAIQEAAAIVAEGLWIADDIRASSAYRAHLARVYTARAIRAARDTQLA
jgi:carbon-monoxide dehydrogenase medium subunit